MPWMSFWKDARPPERRDLEPPVMDEGRDSRWRPAATEDVYCPRSRSATTERDTRAQLVSVTDPLRSAHWVQGSPLLPVAEIRVGASDWRVFQTPAQESRVEFGMRLLHRRDQRGQMLDRNGEVIAPKFRRPSDHPAQQAGHALFGGVFVSKVQCACGRY